MSKEKRGRGRPKGSLNKKTLAKQGAMEETTTLDVSFEEPEIVPEANVGQPDVEPEAEPEVEPEVESEVEPEAEPEPIKRKRAPRKKIPIPESSDDEQVQLPLPPPKKPRVARPVEEPLTYLQLLQRGLVAARATDKANKVARYDAYFSQLH